MSVSSPFMANKNCYVLAIVHTVCDRCQVAAVSLFSTLLDPLSWVGGGKPSRLVWGGAGLTPIGDVTGSGAGREIDPIICAYQETVHGTNNLFKGVAIEWEGRKVYVGVVAT